MALRVGATEEIADTVVESIDFLRKFQICASYVIRSHQLNCRAQHLPSSRRNFGVLPPYSTRAAGCVLTLRQRGEGVDSNSFPRFPICWKRRVALSGREAAHAVAALRRRSTSRMIIGVKISCIASSIFPPGTTSVLARDMNESCSMANRQ